MEYTWVRVLRKLTETVFVCVNIDKQAEATPSVL